MIIRAPLILWPASAWPAARGWITVSLMRRRLAACVRGANTRDPATRQVRLMARGAESFILPFARILSAEANRSPVKSHATYHRDPAAKRSRSPDSRRGPVLHPRLQHRVVVRGADG